MVDEVPSRQKIGDSLRGWFVGDGRGNDVGHISMILFRRDVESRVRIEASEGCEMNVTPKDRYSDVVGFGECLEAEDKHFALFFVLPGRIMVVQIVEQIDLPVKMIEEAAGETKSLVEDANGTNNGGSEKIFEPLKARISNRYPEKDDQVGKGRVCCELGFSALENEVVGIRIIDLTACSFCASVDTHQADASSELHPQRPRAFFDIGPRTIPNNKARIFVLFVVNEAVTQLLWVGPWPSFASRP